MINSVLKNKLYILLFIIVLLGGFLRFYKINEVPVSLYWDEVSSTYNAYSILETGKDEFGNSFPLLFRAFEDYKTPANIYLTAIPVKLFGLNEFSARFTSAFLGTLTILITFALVKELIKKKDLGIDSSLIAILTAFVLALSPWHINFSRTGFEANVGLFFVILGAVFFFRFINLQRFKWIILSMLTFAISFYFYRSIWVFLPLFLMSLILIYRNTLFSKKNIKYTILSLILFGVLLSAFVPVMISSQGLVRANQVAVVYNSQEEVLDASRKQEQTGGLLGKTIYNRRVVYMIESIRGYVAHFYPKFLFFQGDGNGRHGVRDIGVLYLWGLIFIIPGLLFLNKLDRKTKLALLAWLLIAPIPAAVSVPAPHSLRSLNMIPIPQLLIALGVVWLYLRIKPRFRLIYILSVGILISYFFFSYINLYFGKHAIASSNEWADGYKQLSEYVFKNENKYEKVIISGHYWQPYIYFLFYKKYDPAIFQKNGSKQQFDKYIFGGTSWDMNGKELGDQNLKKVAGTENFLVALSPLEYNLQKDDIEITHEIKNHNNETVFILGEAR